MNKINKSTIMLLLVIGSILVSFCIPFFGGLYLSEIINPITLHYECACEEPPILTKFQAFIMSITYLNFLSIGLRHILHLLNFSKFQRKIWLIILFIFNGTSCFIVMDILSSEVSG